MSIPGLTLREMVLSVLQGNEQPLKPSEIAAIIKERYPDYCAQKSSATTQSNFNVAAQIASEISANSKQWMQRHQQLKSSDETPRTYWWEAQEGDDPNAAVAVSQVAASSSATAAFDEHSLYPKLAAYLWGMKARKLYPKRIDEKTSSNTNGSNGNKALHPDVVALEDLMPHPTWTSEMKNWATRSGAPRAKLWSFEVKIKISSIADARDSYFQAVANSAWANYGYLVATHISDKALGELKILTDLHGVGVILLDTDNPVDESTVKLAARERSAIDWGSCNRIASQNSDFKKFIELVADFHLTQKARDSDWDIRDISVGET